MAKFNYNIYYKDAQTGQDLASPVRVGYDSFDTLISETQKTFNGYTARELWEHQKRTPSESSYNSSYAVQKYNRDMAVYRRLIAINRANLEKVENYRNQPGFFEYNGISGVSKYNTSKPGSYDYFKDYKVFTNQSDVEVLSRPIRYNEYREYNQSGTKDSSGMYPGWSVRLRNPVSRTLSGKDVYLRIRVNNYVKVSFDDATPGIWVAEYNNTGGLGLWFYDVYDISFSFFFEDEEGNPIKLITSTAVVDIDFYQRVSASYNNSETVYSRPPGSNLTFDGTYIGDDYGFKSDEESSVPRGSFVLAGVGSRIDFRALGNRLGRTTIFDPNGENAGDYFELGFFGNASRGETFTYYTPTAPIEPTKTNNITILYDRVARIRPWAIRNSGSWKSFVTKNIHMVRRRDGEFMQLSTEVNEEDVGKQFTRLNNTGNYLPSYSLSGQGIRKSGVWKQQGKIGS